MDRRFIRGLGTWEVYRRDIHRFVEFLQRAGLRDLRQARSVFDLARAYISSRGQALRGDGGSFQTIEREISALTKLSHSLDVHAERHGGDVVARLSSTHGMLVPSVDPLKPPFSPVGLLWENGDFARNSSSAILSFVNSVGVILAAAYPAALAARFVDQNTAAWTDWMPAAPDEKAQRSAARMEAAFPKREHVALTPELVLRFLDKNPGSEVLSLKPGPALDTVIWKNGVSRSGKRVNAEHMFLRPFFERFMDPVPAE